ncbi:hypothetical protein BaRGS_00024753 [Batillaria attramentaria]|uniref:COX assembly mitochondrial protein n=1 Tax=Batillaria attramentaria TaxID=370345 RepID=A0ABD0KA88_9CAEN
MARVCGDIAMNLKRKCREEYLARKRAEEEDKSSGSSSESKDEGNLEVNMWMFDMYYAQRRRLVAEAEKNKASCSE